MAQGQEKTAGTFIPPANRRARRDAAVNSISLKFNRLCRI